MRRILVLAALAGTAHRLPAQAAPPRPTPPVEPGSRVQVRILTESGVLSRPVEGTVERISRDTLVLSPKGGGLSQAFPAAPGTVVSVYSGRRSSLFKGAIIGGFAGLVTGGLSAGFASRCESGQMFCSTRREVTVRWALVLAGGGAAIGLLVGALTSHDTWARTSGSSGWPFISMGNRGLDAGFSISF